MAKDICPKCGKLVWLSQRYMIADGQASHIECETPEQGSKTEASEAAHSLKSTRKS